MQVTEFDIRVDGRTVTCALAEPTEGGLVNDPGLVLTFAGVRTHHDSLREDLYDAATRSFVRAGHRALSFDLPFHGSRLGPGQAPGIEGMRDAVLAGNDPFKQVIADAKEAIDECIRRRLARPGHIYGSGISRGGYCVLRIAAVDTRIAAVVALAPVMDWRPVREWAAVKDRPEVVNLVLDPWAEAFVGRTIWAAIGNCDDRVGTHCCLRFFERLFEAEFSRGIRQSRHVLTVDDQSRGHGLSPHFYIDGGEFLAQLATKNSLKR